MPKEIISLPSLEVQAGSRPDSQGNKKKQSSMDLAQCEREVMYGDIDLKSPNHEKCKKHEDPVQNGDIDLFQVQQSSKIVTKDRTKACVGKESSEDKGESSVAESSCIDLKNKKYQKQKEPPGSLHLGKVQELFNHDGSQKADEEKESPEHKKVRSVVGNKSMAGQKSSEIVIEDGPKACAGRERPENMGKCIDLKNETGSLQMGEVKKVLNHNGSQKACEDLGSSQVYGNVEMVKSVKDIRKPGTVLQFERIIRFYNLEILTYYHYIIIKDAKHIVDEKEITVVSFPGSVRQLFLWLVFLEMPPAFQETVKTTDLIGKCSVVHYKKCLPDDEVRQKMEEVVQNKELRYNFFAYNCESMVNLCKTGHMISFQIRKFIYKRFLLDWWH